jgi:hypothetical protein
MHAIVWMGERYLPLRIKFNEALWRFGGPLLDFIGTYIAAPVVKSYGRRYMWPDIRDFIIIPYFKTDYNGGDPSTFRLSLPQRSIIHWVTVLLVDFGLFVVAKLALDTARLVYWIAEFSIANINGHPGKWITWATFKLSIFMLCCITLFLCFSGFSIIAALLWWLMWFLSEREEPRIKLSAVIWICPLLLFIFILYPCLWWIVYSEPFWSSYHSK